MNPAAKVTLGFDFSKATRGNAGWLERHSRGRDEPGRQSSASYKRNPKVPVRGPSKDVRLRRRPALGGLRDIVAAGMNPAAKATPVRHIRKAGLLLTPEQVFDKV